MNLSLGVSSGIQTLFSKSLKFLAFDSSLLFHLDCPFAHVRFVDLHFHFFTQPLVLSITAYNFTNQNEDYFMIEYRSVTECLPTWLTCPSCKINSFLVACIRQSIFVHRKDFVDLKHDEEEAQSVVKKVGIGAG